MASHLRQSYSSELAKLEQTISNALNNEFINTRISAVGFDSNKLNNLMDLLQKVNDLFTEYSQAKKLQAETTAILYNEINGMKSNNQKYRQYLNLNLNYIEKDLNKDLLVIGQPNQNIDNWIQDSYDFYQICINNIDLLNIFNQYNITAEEFNSQLLNIKNIQIRRQLQLTRIGYTQATNEEKIKVFQSLSKEVNHLRGIAKIVFKDDPQKLEILGVFIRNK